MGLAARGILCEVHFARLFVFKHVVDAVTHDRIRCRQETRLDRRITCNVFEIMQPELDMCEPSLRDVNVMEDTLQVPGDVNTT